jgi:membrane protease YdiL (CAAX protease family)
VSDLPGISYLRVGRVQPRWRLVVEVLLAILWWFVGAGIVGAVILGAADAKKLEELDILTKLVMIHLLLAMMVPAALAAAHVMGRRAGLLASVTARMRWRWLVRCVVLALAVQLAYVGFGVLLDLVVSGSVEGLDRGGPRFLQIVALTVVLVPFQAAGEEFFNRATLQQVIGGLGGPRWLAIGLSTVVFVAMHGTPNPGTVAIAAMGMTYAWLTLETGGLEAAVAGHAINNIVAFTLSAASHGEKQLDPQENNAHVGWIGVAIQVVTIGLYTALVMRAWRRSGLSSGAEPADIPKRRATR